MEILVFLIAVVVVFIYIFRQHPARLIRPSIAEEMITNRQTIEETLKVYLGEETAEPAPIVEQPAVAEIPTPIPEPKQVSKPQTKPLEETKAPQPSFNVRDFVVYNVIWNKRR